MKRLLAPIVAFVLALCVAVVPTVAQQGNIPPPDPGCPTLQHLRGQSYTNPGLEPEYPIWCYQQSAPGEPTHHGDSNTWLDSWDNDGPAAQRLADGDYDYRVFNIFQGPQGSFRSGTFVNSDHWMLDLVDQSQFRLSGGILVSPNQTFQFEDGRFVVEVDAAAGGDAMGGADAFYEIDVSPALAPTGIQVDPLYGYGSFGGVGAVGCRLERAADGPHTVCSLYDNSHRDAGGTDVVDHSTGRPGRVWETQGVGTARTAARVEGGYPNWPIPGTNLQVRDVWRQCLPGEHDLHCRDRFRLELTKDSLHLYANGYLVFLVEGLYARNPETGADNRIPDSWFQSGVRPYFTSWINSGQHNPIRWHWNDVLVNPDAAPGHSISFCEGQPRSLCPHDHIPGQPEVGASTAGEGTPVPVVTPTPIATTASGLPTSTVTLTPVVAEPTSTPTPIVLCRVSVELLGTPGPYRPC